MEPWLISAIVILLASVLQTSTGFGFAVLATPFLVVIYDIHNAIQISLILQIIISIIMFNLISTQIDKNVFLNFFKGSILGLPIGVIILLYSDVRLLKISIALIILLLAVLLFFRLEIKKSSNKELIVGSISGLMTTSMGIPGIPLLLYFAGTDTKKEVARGTTLAFFCYICIVSLILQLIFSGTNKYPWYISLISTSVLLVGLFSGHFLFKFISQRTFQNILKLLLAYSGIYLLIASI